MPTPESARRHPYAVFYGDSILTGWRGLTSPRNRWPVLTCDRLGWRETTLAVDGMGYYRRRGARDATGEPVPSASDTTSLDAAIRLRPDVVVVCLGANDLQFVQAAGDRVRASMDRDLGRLRRELPAAHVVATTYLPHAALSQVAQRFHAWLDDACRTHDVAHLDSFRLVIDGDEQLLCDDGVHPNDDGHRALAEVAEAGLRDLGVPGH